MLIVRSMFVARARAGCVLWRLLERLTRAFNRLCSTTQRQTAAIRAQIPGCTPTSGDPLRTLR
jgi:hypothetical protein